MIGKIRHILVQALSQALLMCPAKPFCYAAAVSSCLLDVPSMQLQKFGREKKSFLKSNITLFRSSLPTPFLKFLICLLQLCASSFSIHINEGTASWVCPLKCYSPVKDSWKRSILDKARHQGKTRKILHFPAQLGSDKGFTGTHRFGYS